MTAQVITTYFHYLGFLTLFSMLILEHFLIKPGLNIETARKIITIDLIYGLSALIVLITGLLKVMHFDKGPDYYLQSAPFFIKLGLFIGAAILSIHPTILFQKWRRQLKENGQIILREDSLKPVIMLIRLELLFVLLIPLFAILMARGGF